MAMKEVAPEGGVADDRAKVAGHPATVMASGTGEAVALVPIGIVELRSVEVAVDAVVAGRPRGADRALKIREVDPRADVARGLERHGAGDGDVLLPGGVETMRVRRHAAALRDPGVVRRVESVDAVARVAAAVEEDPRAHVALRGVV